VLRVQMLASPPDRFRRRACRSATMCCSDKGGASGAEVSKESQAQTKQEAVLGLLRRKNGVSLEHIMETTGWQAHSVRGFLSGTVKKKLGLKLSSKQNDAGIRKYFLRSAS